MNSRRPGACTFSCSSRCVCTLLESGVCCGNVDKCNEYIFWIGANEAASIQALHWFIFREISKFITLRWSGLKNHPFIHFTSKRRCKLSYSIPSLINRGIYQYNRPSNRMVSGLPGTGHNNWSHAVTITVHLTKD